ncbi:MAG: hypothetical protein ABIK32_04700 [Chloroflexota bacterium]|nr:hypothetical protein [Chloroflexota bacterium]
MSRQWGKNAKRKLYLLAALGLILVLSGGVFAYTYTTAVGTISVGEPSADVATSNISASQPGWSSVTDNLSENTTCGEVPAGDLFDITPNAAYSGDVQVGVYLTNAADLTSAYKYINMKLYLEGSDEAGETPSYRVLSLQNGRANFSLSGISSSSKSWTQTTQSDFEGGTLNQVDTTTSPDDVILDKFTDNVTDSFDNSDNIASSANVTISGGQVKLTATGASDNETLRPNTAGDETNILEQYPATGAHWDKVDEATSDDDGTYVQTNNATWEEDLYNITNHTTGGGIINYVRVYTVARAVATPVRTNAYVHIKTNGVEYNGTEETTTTSYAPYSYQWNNNPQTGNPWTWNEIDALQIGVGLRSRRDGGPPSERYTRCTQVYAEVNYTPYDSPGTITSVNLLSSANVVSIDDFYYDASAIPSGTSLKAQFSTDNSTWYNSSGTPGGWDTLSQGSANISLSGLGWSGPNFYYHMEFTSDGTDTPVLDEIRVYFSTYYASGDLTSSTHDGGDYGNWDWQNISFTINEPSGTDLKFQLRSAATEGGLNVAAWYGPTGTGDYYTTSGTAINSVHDGDRWLQYKAYFSGPGDATPKLSDITITYTVALSAYKVEIIGGGYCLISDNTSEWAAGWTTTPEFYCETTQR